VLQWAAGRRSKALRVLGVTAAMLLMARALSRRDAPLARLQRSTTVHKPAQ